MEKELNYSLTSEDLQKLIPFEINIIHYKDLRNYTDIYDMLYPNNACILFFESEENEGQKYGHWTAITISPKSQSQYKPRELDQKDVICFFDSYGTIPDDQKKELNKKHSEEIGQSQNFLTNLLYAAHKDNIGIEYNELKLQKLKDGVNTCGRFAAIRVLTKMFSLELLQKFLLIPDTSPDEKVVLFTQPVLDNEITAEQLENKLNEMIIEEFTTPQENNY